MQRTWCRHKGFQGLFDIKSLNVPNRHKLLGIARINVETHVVRGKIEINLETLVAKYGLFIAKYRIGEAGMEGMLAAERIVFFGDAP